MRITGKQGMSPLIATVLLIAFAVALGAMIMNWSAGIDADEDTIDCSGLVISLKQAICAEGNEVTLAVGNDGERRVDALEIILHNDAEELNLRLGVKDSSIVSGESIERMVTALIPSLDTQITVNPLIRVDGQLVACEPRGIVQDELVSC